MRLGDRDAMLTLHGTLANVLNRKNTLNYEIDPLTGRFSDRYVGPLPARCRGRAGVLAKPRTTRCHRIVS